MALLALTLASCAALPGGGPAPLDTFELSAPSIDAHGHSRRQILIAQPSALKALDSQNIVIKPSDRSIQYLKGAQWADRLPLIVQARLAETFQRSGSFAGVGKPGEGLAIDYQVIVEIRSFEVRVDGGEHAEVDLFVRILNDRNGEVRASKSFTATAPVSGSGNPGLCQRARQRLRRCGQGDRALDGFGDLISRLIATLLNDAGPDDAPRTRQQPNRQMKKGGKFPAFFVFAYRLISAGGRWRGPAWCRPCRCPTSGRSAP